MRMIRAASFISLSGVVQSPRGAGEVITGGFKEGGWMFRLWDEAAGEEMDRLVGQPNDLLLRRRTYEIAAYWPMLRGKLRRPATYSRLQTSTC